MEDEHPPSVSAYDDGSYPRSAAPSRSPPTLPVNSGGSGSTSLSRPVIGTTRFPATTADAIAPPVYQEASGGFAPSSSGETSVNSLSRVLGASGLSAPTIEKVCFFRASSPHGGRSLISSWSQVVSPRILLSLGSCGVGSVRQRCARLRRAIDVERVAKLAEENTFPEPPPDASQLSAAPSTSSFKIVEPAIYPGLFCACGPDPGHRTATRRVIGVGRADAFEKG